MENHCGISLMPILSKFLQSIVQDQLLTCFSQDELFDNSPYGFRKGRSCEDVLLACVEKWRHACDEGKSFVHVLLDRVE